MITEPNHLQHKDIQKHGLNVSKLEEATFEALGSFFGDVENPNNAKKKPYLREIFKVARYEERYKNGEIGMPTTQASESPRGSDMSACRRRIRSHGHG